MNSRVWRTIGLATLVAGTLDILSAFVFGATEGQEPVAILVTVASGPFGSDIRESAFAAPLGLSVHYTIMFLMAATYALAARRRPILLRHPYIAGSAYGVALWLVMYWIVLPLRWPQLPWPHEAAAIAKQLFSHCVLTGIPIAWIVSQRLSPRNERAN